MDFGLNLYSVRNLIQTEEDFLQTAFALKKMGYSYLQYSGAPFDAKMIKKVSQKTDMAIKLTHVSIDRIINDTDELIKEHQSFGCDNIGLGAMPKDAIIDGEKFKQTVALLDEAGKKMEKKGLKFFYHHHHFEFIKRDGKTLFDYMLENSEHINFTADTYWLQYGGMEIIPTLQKLKGKMECVHLKDYKIELLEDGTFAPKFAPVGDGVLDFKKIINEMKALGVKNIFVEQDNAAEMEDTLGQVERSVKWLKSNIQ